MLSASASEQEVLEFNSRPSYTVSCKLVLQFEKVLMTAWARFPIVSNGWQSLFSSPPNRPVTRGGRSPLKICSPPLEKCVAHKIKLLDIVKKKFGPLSENDSPRQVSQAGYVPATEAPFEA